MKVMVIPDVHLKPDMFKKASEILNKGLADRAVCLMDIADDWYQEKNIDLYIRTYDAAVRFANEFSDTLWCYGNHDLSYLWNKHETGFSIFAQPTVCLKMNELIKAAAEGKNIAYIHHIDGYLFMHGGLNDEFVRRYVSPDDYDDVEKVVETINSLGKNEIWHETSPIWFRPQYHAGRMYGEDKLVQVVGHTPVEGIYKDGNVISCDVFSTYRDKRPIGTQEFLIIDTESGEYCMVR